MIRLSCTVCVLLVLARLVADEPTTFEKQIAPILHRECASCHRLGQNAPFPLLTFEDARRHAQQIVEVTETGYMPPWLPEPGHGRFANERRLAPEEKALLKRWFDHGMVRGERRDLPSAGVDTGEWRLGTPDLVVELPTYQLAAEGQDVYWNFVAPISVSTNLLVRGVEFLPGNARVVHHAFINIDETGHSRRRALKNNPPGFPGMELPETAFMPGGQLLGWQPGKVASFGAKGLAWRLRTNTDLVLQAHLNPTGKPEEVRPKLGFYFTTDPPTNSAFRIKLAALKLDIPAGAQHYSAEESYRLPIDTALVRVGAHAHYLGKKFEAYAELPDGRTEPLLLIKQWDFKWQGDYEYAEPVILPAGSRIVARFLYDNSTNNIRNPSHPPRRVRYGLQTTDEMGELYFQAVPLNPRDYGTLARDYSKYFLGVSADFFTHRIRLDPEDAVAHARLGRLLAGIGSLETAAEHLQRALHLEPDSAQTHLDLGLVYLRQKQFQEAAHELLEAARANPDESQAFGSLGVVALQTGRRTEAERYFREALRLDPDDQLAKRYLQQLQAQSSR